jgi:hypothetical protein
VNDEALIARQAKLQREATALIDRLDLIGVLGKAGPVVQVGSFVTGLMVWRDIDLGVAAPGLTSEAAWETMRPLLGRCSSLHYLDDHDERRHYFVLRIAGWKIDVSVWTTEIPPAVEEFQAELRERLTDSLRLTILRLKEAWHPMSCYPDVVSAWEIYDAVLHHQAESLDDLDDYLAARGLPTLRQP